MTVYLCTIGCVDPFNAQVTEQRNEIVVQGMITDLPPPYTVTISETSNYSRNISGFTTFVSQATVMVCDDLGTCIPFYELSKGKYETTASAPMGAPGRYYHVEIETKDGRRIESVPELLKASPEIAKVYSEYDIASVQREGFQVYADTQDPAGENNFYRWETIGYFPYSEKCFYVIPGSNTLFVDSDKNRDGKVISRVHLRDVAFNRRDYYVVEVYQYALSGDAFQFFNRIKNQSASTGSIFDPPPTFIDGNMRSINSDESVLGYFVAAGASKKGVAINRAIEALTPVPRSKDLALDPCYCGTTCPQSCGPFNPCLCGTAPCPPECHSIPGLTSVAPEAWPLAHNPC